MEDEGDEEEEEEEDEGVNFRMTIPLGWWKCWREGCEEKNPVRGQRRKAAARTVMMGKTRAEVDGTRGKGWEEEVMKGGARVTEG